MSDSEDSIVSLHGSEKSATHDEIVETVSNHNEDKLEEFQDQLQSTIVSHSASEEEEQLEEEDNANEKKIVGRLSYSLVLNIIKIHTRSVFLMNKNKFLNKKIKSYTST